MKRLLLLLLLASPALADQSFDSFATGFAHGLEQSLYGSRPYESTFQAEQRQAAREQLMEQALFYQQQQAWAAQEQADLQRQQLQELRTKNTWWDLNKRNF